MISVMLAAFCSPALAQSRVTTPPRVDPDYLAYEEALEALWDLDYVGSDDPSAQLWPGMVGFMDLNNNPIGTVFVGGSFPQMQEAWFMTAPPSPGAAFSLVHQGGYPPGTEAIELAQDDPNWDLHPCYDMNVKYTQVPNVTLTANLDYEPNIDRYAFELWQDGELVGRMLREHHHVPNTQVKFVDHWAFFTIYEPPADLGDNVLVLVAPQQFATTSAFFADLNNDPSLYWGFAQIQYKRLLGYQCVAQLSF